jgi:hypothetical protein|tara:strand:- start:1221 stop:1433 length:213 start_codon:yes stop_codon:yes gene_type:complete
VIERKTASKIEQRKEIPRLSPRISKSVGMMARSIVAGDRSEQVRYCGRVFGLDGTVASKNWRVPNGELHL